MKNYYYIKIESTNGGIQSMYAERWTGSERPNFLNEHIRDNYATCRKFETREAAEKWIKENDKEPNLNW